MPRMLDTSPAPTLRALWERARERTYFDRAHGCDMPAAHVHVDSADGDPRIAAAWAFRSADLAPAEPVGWWAARGTPGAEVRAFVARCLAVGERPPAFTAAGPLPPALGGPVDVLYVRRLRADGRNNLSGGPWSGAEVCDPREGAPAWPVWTGYRLPGETESDFRARAERAAAQVRADLGFWNRIDQPAGAR